MIRALVQRTRQLAKWLVPGIRVKRYVALVFVGVSLVAVGAILLADVVTVGVAQVLYAIVRAALWVSGGERWGLVGAGALLIALGVYCVFLGLRATVRSVAGLFLPRGDHRLAELMVQRRALGRGPRVVALGGGTGLSTLLRGLKRYTMSLTAVVTVFDDGGSSGRLRRELGILPPGDINDCLVALAEAEPLMTRLFEYRFDRGDLRGHSFGNLFLASMMGVGGDLVSAVRLASRVLAIRGQVLPATVDNIVLCAEFLDGTTAEGESAIPAARKAIRRVYLKPADARAVPEVLDAITHADLILLGPGSLFTSVLPNLLVTGIGDALRRAEAPVVQIVNVMTQPGETDGFRASDHVRAVVEHAGPIVRAAIVNDQMPRNAVLLQRYRGEGAVPVEPDLDRIRQMGLVPFAYGLISETELVRHNPTSLAEAVLDVLDRLSGARRRVARVSVINP
ncbi:MAG: YvcK family protein [Armatimonadota bacterium]|nr:YvcK family protein [Armatimonadota bacterium]MDR5698190.1 YvcK family protein [Armatimonadota bacterium]